MFRIESYITPIIWSYFSKYVKNFNSHDFQVSLWNGGAVFSNLELNLDVLDSELQIPLTFASGHVQELKITVPWRKITSEPIVLNVKSMELVLKYKEKGTGPRVKPNSEEILTPRGDPNRNDENAGYMRSLIAKIVTNVRVNFENVVIKYVESDIAFSVNVGEASLTAADENWKDAFLDRIVCSPEFILRKKLSFSDVNICLDRCNNAGVVDKFHDPMLYRCDFDVRIIQKFATSTSRIPYFYRMDLFLGHLQFCVTDEQIPMLVRLYTLFTWLMQAGSMDQSEGVEKEEEHSVSSNAVSNDSQTEIVESSNEKTIESDKNLKDPTIEDSSSWTGWAASWLYSIPTAVFGEEEENGDEGDDMEGSSMPPELAVVKIESDPGAPEQLSKRVDESEKEESQLEPPTTHFGIYIKTLTIIFKAVQRSCDRLPVARRKVISIYPFLKCSIQGICCDFILRGNENSHLLGVSSIMVHGLGFCPCGVHDCTSSAGGIPSQGGECYFEAGKIMPEFAASSLFQEEGVTPPEWCYDLIHKDCLNYEAENLLMQKSPAFVLKYIVTRSHVDRNNQDLQTPEIRQILYHCVTAPCKVLLCSGLIHRLKMINTAINNYGYMPYGVQPLPVNSSRYLSLAPLDKYPEVTYRLVIRQPLIEILAADHPSDYSPEKRAEYYRRSGGLVVPAATLPRFSPEWPRMIISCDILECTAVDEDHHFFRLRSRFLQDSVGENLSTVNNNNNKLSRQIQKSFPQGEELAKYMNQKLAKKAFIEFSIYEVLVSFVSEPVELNIGVKSATMRSDFSNHHLYTLTDIVLSSAGCLQLEALTCSTRLQQRSNVLWLPVSAKVLTRLDWEPKLHNPSYSVGISTGSLTLFAGPETIVAFTQLSDKLSVYLQEFLPRSAANSQSMEVPPLSSSSKLSVFSDTLKNDSLEKHLISDDATGLPDVNKGIGICTKGRSVSWKYPQKRIIRTLYVDCLPFPQKDPPSVPYAKLVLEYYEELSQTFHKFASFPMNFGKGRSLRFSNDVEKIAVAKAIWRLRIVSEFAESNSLESLELLAKCISIDSVHIPEVTIMMDVQDMNLNLVNNTFYAGKEISIPALKSYINTDGVSPDDHIMSTLHFKKTSLLYSTGEKAARFNADCYFSLRVLNYESLVLEEVMESAFGGIAVTLPCHLGSNTLNLVTDNISMKIGASFIHSIMYSSALWNQVINSFDPRASKMIASEDQPKIILNRVLLCNDLSSEIQLRYSHPEFFGVERVSSKDCKAVSFLSNNETNAVPTKHGQIYLSCPEISSQEIEVDVYKQNYTAVDIDTDKTIFVHVSNLSASQKLLKVSGSLILANGLEQAIEVSVVPQYSLNSKTCTIPSRGIGPTYVRSISEIDHFRVRLVSSSGSIQNPWSDFINTADILKIDGTSSSRSVLVALLRQSENNVTKTQVWLTLITEKLFDTMRYLVVVSPIYCLRSWLCGETYVHLTSSNETSTDMYSLKGKGDEVQIQFGGEGDVTRHMKFQSSLKVPPSMTSVPLLPAGPLLDKAKRVMPIDEIIAQITGIRSPSPDTIASELEPKARWPFISEDIPKHEWNTEINPETEIMVSFTPWIDGLPTAVADVRPWALFINLSGVELLFAQETCISTDNDSDWDQFWVPYKCVFSPKPIKIPSGKFRIGIMMNDFLVKSPSLRFSDQPERLSVKKINKDGMVPIDCFSRLDLFGGSQVACLTIETRVKNKILVMTVRPTYSIQNRSPFEVYAEGVTISAPVPQRRESWSDARLGMYSTLEPVGQPNDDLSTTAVPILHFTTDGQDYSATTPSYKYLALSCGGPWWFVQLVDSSESAHTGGEVSGLKMAVTLPRIDCSILSPLYRHKLKKVKVSSEPMVVGAYTKNGQVWVAISLDNAPQLIIHNKSCLPLFYAEKDKTRDIPRHHTSCFEQFLMIPPKTRGHFSFANAYTNFPQLNKVEDTMPQLMMAEASQDLVDFVTSHQTETFVSVTERPRKEKQSLGVSTGTTLRSPSGNLLFPDFDLEWTSLTNFHKNPTQYARFGQQQVKISVEIVGYTHHVLIENTRLREISANSIRSRFENPLDSEVSKADLTVDKPSSHHGHAAGLSFNDVKEIKSHGEVAISIGDLDDEDDDDGPPSPSSEQESQVIHRPWKIKAFIPEMYISIQEDFERSGMVDNEILGITLEPLMLEQVPIIEDSRLRPKECPRRESWIYITRIGNLQMDTPSTTERPVQFPVLLEPIKKAIKTAYSIPFSSFDIPNFLETIEIPEILNVDSTITFTRVAADEINLETVWMKVLPFSMYIEDRLLSYVLPSINNILQVFNEGYFIVDKCASLSVSSTPRKDFISLPELDENIGDSRNLVNFVYPEYDIGNVSKTYGKHSSTHLMNSSYGEYNSRNIGFAYPPGSTSSGKNSSTSSVISSGISNLRLASVSPPPPSPMIPYETHGSNTLGFKTSLSDSPSYFNYHSKDLHDENVSDLFAVSRIYIPKELIKLFHQLSRPVRLKVVEIQGSEVELTLRMKKIVYVALDRSVVQLKPFKAYSSVTTDYHLGLELTMHYTVGTIFTVGNPVRVLGSMELLGSPGTLVRTVGTGLRDFVVYPYEGILQGPVGFVSGLGYGMTSLLRSVTSGTLVSLTNWAESVSRNIDRLTLDQQEQLITEAERQVELQGFSDGLVHGISGFGIRILGAIGGLTHHPIKSVLEKGPCTTGVIGGVGRGVLGAVAKPIGGVAELISMTGQGVLLATGWKPKPKVKKPKNRVLLRRKSSSESTSTS